MENVSVGEIIHQLGSSEERVRKMAVFRLQTSIADPSFAEWFILEGGLARLKHLVLHATGNTLAYSLTSYANLLEVDKGWESVGAELVDRIVELIVTHPLVNVLRGAMSILVSIVTHTHLSSYAKKSQLGLQALEPALKRYPQFLEVLVDKLRSGDHALCSPALQLINSLARDSLTSNRESEWPGLFKRFQDLGVVAAVYDLMQGAALQELAQTLLDYQSLMKVLLQRWRNMPVSSQNAEHRRILRSLEEPVADFSDVGFLGMVDLMDYVATNEEELQRVLQEQETHARGEENCPFARASLSVTWILYDLYEVSKADIDDARNGYLYEARANYEKYFTPLLLHWRRLHAAGLRAFFRLWTATGAEAADFHRVADLVAVLLETVLSEATRTTTIESVEEELEGYDLARLRELQMELLDLRYEEVRGDHLLRIREELRAESLQFMKEQRIRCLLQGNWFPASPPPSTTHSATLVDGAADAGASGGAGTAGGTGPASHPARRAVQGHHGRATPV
ncbi:hypothetical protein KEM52_006687, partial [Ascosphaera acerosa]